MVFGVNEIDDNAIVNWCAAELCRACVCLIAIHDNDDGNDKQSLFFVAVKSKRYKQTHVLDV